jgi:glutaconate CoA-transferase subunit A
MSSKVKTLDEAAAMVADGSCLGVGGVMDQMVPVAFLLELVRRRARGLHVVGVASGLSADVLVGGGCADELSCAIVSFEALGTSKVFRRRVESGALKFNEHSELTMITRLSAAAGGLPFLPTRGALGTDIADAHPDALRRMDCPFTGRPLLACAALAPDVSVIHVHAADASGNAQLPHKHIWHDSVLARAGRRVIVTAEEILPAGAARDAPERTLLPGFAVDAVVHAPRGAWPTTCMGRYAADEDFLGRWLRESGDDASMDAFIERWIRDGAP